MKRWIIIFVLIGATAYQGYQIYQMNRKLYWFGRGLKIALQQELQSIERDRRMMQSVDGLYQAVGVRHD